MKYTDDEMKSILRDHLAWLKGESDGIMADLRHANLEGAYLQVACLRDANLRDADL